LEFVLIDYFDNQLGLIATSYLKFVSQG